MKYGIREICEVVLKAKANMKVGNKLFYKNEPVIYFDSLKTSTMEGAATTVYAQGGRGNSRLIAWEGERTVTFTMEDALISTVSLAILSGADVIDATETAPVIQHIVEDVKYVTPAQDKTDAIYLEKEPYIPDNDATGHYIYVMALDDNGDPATEPYIFKKGTKAADDKNEGFKIEPMFDEDAPTLSASIKTGVDEDGEVVMGAPKLVRVDYYTARKSGATQIEITPDKFGGNFYLEASTLFRNTDGVDMPAEFIIPNCKVQSNFTFTMASSGDPSTFTFTMDAFPDYTRFGTKKVISVIQVIEDEGGKLNAVRTKTDAGDNFPNA